MLKKILSILTVLFIFAQSATATNLPKDLWDYVQGVLPDSKQRFDSVIELKNGNLYIPLSPAIKETPEKIEIEYFDRFGEKHNLKAEGYFARVILHEMDHLDGILFIDKMVRRIDTRRGR